MAAFVDHLGDSSRRPLLLVVVVVWRVSSIAYRVDGW